MSNPKMNIWNLVVIFSIVSITGCTSHENQDSLPPNGQQCDMCEEENRCEERPLGSPSTPGRVWTLSIARNNPPLSAWDENTGEVHGLAVDAMQAACKLANQKCVFTFHQDISRCWDDGSQSSKGLDNHWLDGCPTYHKNPIRSLMYAFSRPYTKEPHLYLYVRQRDNVMLDDIRRENSMSIGFVRNFWMNPECLERNGIRVNMELTRFYDDFSELFESLDRGDVRLIFTIDRNPDPEKFRLLDLGARQLLCGDGGGDSVMMRKDNLEMLEWLNPAIEQLIRSDEYKRMCYIWSKVFDRDINCY